MMRPAFISHLFHFSSSKRVKMKAGKKKCLFGKMSVSSPAPPEKELILEKLATVSSLARDAVKPSAPDNPICIFIQI